ncbi:hypothetical protein S245_034321 [Arachis hypogaea]
MIVIELRSKNPTLRCALFGEYADQINYFLAFGYVEQLVVLVQLAKVKFFWCHVGLQNVMHATRICLILKFWRVRFISLEDDFMRLTRRCTIEDLKDNNEILLKKDLGDIRFVSVAKLFNPKIVLIIVIFVSIM